MNSAVIEVDGLRFGIWKRVVILGMFVLLAALLLSACTGQVPRLDVAAGATAQPTAMVVMGTAVPGKRGQETGSSGGESPHSTLAPPATASPDPTDIPAATVTPPTVTAEPQSVSFAVIGDYGTNGMGTQEVAALVDGWDPDLVLTVGDTNYPDGAAGTMAGNVTQHYGRFIDEKRFFPTLGNHDMTTDFGRPYFDYFELPGNERYYDFVRGDVHFFAVNSDWREVDGIGAGSRQAVWLREGLEASDAVWQVVYFHAPPYVSMEAKQVPALRWPFAQWGADLVLSGHAHLYERLQVEGIPYVVNGLGGGGIYAFDEQSHPGSQVRFNDDYGALLVEVSGTGLIVQFVTRGGAVVDRVVVFPSG